MKFKKDYKLLITVVLLAISFQTFGQIKGLTKNLKSNCNSSHKSLTEYLQKLEGKVADNTVASNSFKYYLKTANKHLLSIEKKCPSDDVSNEKQQLEVYKANYEQAISEQSIEKENTSNIADKATEVDSKSYFKKINRLLFNIYSDSPNGADATAFGNHSNTTIELLDDLKDFNLASYYSKIEEFKDAPDFKKSEYYINQNKSMIADYDNFISKSRNTYNNYIADLRLYGVKGDPVKELKELNEANAFCDILLKISPENELAKQWKSDVMSKIDKVSKSLSFKSVMHKKYLGKMVFSKKPLDIGNESQSEITTSFNKGDYIYATVYLGTNARDLTNSYALNKCKVKINNYLIAPSDETGVWFTTKMQDSNVVQFAILPNNEWLSEHGSHYTKNGIYTHKNIKDSIEREGEVRIEVEVELLFRNGSIVNGSFVIN